MSQLAGASLCRWTHSAFIILFQNITREPNRIAFFGQIRLLFDFVARHHATRHMVADVAMIKPDPRVIRHHAYAQLVCRLGRRLKR